MTDGQFDEAEDYDPFEAFDKAQGAGSVDDPYPVFDRLLRQAAVHEGGVGRHFEDATTIEEMMAGERRTFTAFSYEAVQRVLREHETFSSSGYADSMGLVMGHTILEMDEPEHHEYRGLIQQAFTKREMDRWEHEIVGPIVHGLIDEFAARGNADLVKELTFTFPNQVIATAMGLAEADRPQFYRWAVEITNMASEPARGFAASQALGDYFGALARERRVTPGDDLISLLVEASLDGHTLTDDEVIAFLRLLLPAGSETTYRSSSNLLVGLLTNPEQLAALARDRTLMTRAIEEGLRWEPPLTGIGRTAAHDVELCGVAIPAGSPVGVCLGAANHDPSVFERPHDFDLLRGEQNHLAFASGPHMCIGMHLARMETRVLLDAVLDRLPALRAAPEAEPPKITGLTFRSPRNLFVEFEPAA
jgi:cytochrome P450